MKKIIILIGFLLLFFNSSKSQTINVELINVNGFVEVVTEYNVPLIPNDSSYTVKDTIITVKDKIISDKRGNQVYNIFYVRICCNSINYVKAFSKTDIINNYIKVDFDSVQNVINAELEIKEMSEQLIKTILVERGVIVLEELYDKLKYYHKIIKGKSSNKIADILYDEGFSRSYSNEGSNFYTIYSNRWSFDNGDYYSITINTWFSYGYGNLYYDIDYSAYLKRYGYIIYNSEETELGSKLFE